MSDRIEFEAKQSADLYGWTGTILIAAGGECPAKLKETSEEAVHLWVNRVITAGHENGVHYSPNALRLWAAQVFERASQEFADICQHIASALELTPSDLPKPKQPLPKPQPAAAADDDWLKPAGETKKPKPSAAELSKSLGQFATQSDDSISTDG